MAATVNGIGRTTTIGRELMAASLRDRILASTTATEIDTLLSEAKDYQASPGTRGKWAKAAKARKAELAKAA